MSERRGDGGERSERDESGRGTCAEREDVERRRSPEAEGARGGMVSCGRLVYNTSLCLPLAPSPSPPSSLSLELLVILSPPPLPIKLMVTDKHMKIFDKNKGIKCGDLLEARSKQSQSIFTSMWS